MLDLILIIVVLLLIFGGGKLREAGSDLGAVVKGVRKGVRRSIQGGAPPRAPVPTHAQPDAEFPEVLAARQTSSREKARASHD